MKKGIVDLIAGAYKTKCKVGLCGQTLSDYPEFAAFLAGMNSLTVMVLKISSSLLALDCIKKGGFQEWI